MALALDPVVMVAAQVVLAAVFALSAVGKLRAWDAFVGIVENYQILPRVAVRPVAYALPVAELAVAVGVLFATTRRYAAIAALVLLAVFSVAITVNLGRGRRHIDCGCFGFGPSARQTLSWWLVARNGALIALAAILVPAVTLARPAHALDLVTGIAGAAGIVVLYLTLTQLRAVIAAGAGTPIRTNEARSHD